MEHLFMRANCSKVIGEIMGAIMGLTVAQSGLAQTPPAVIPSPVLQDASLMTAGAVGPAALINANGQEFDATYDTSGRLSSLRAKHGRNQRDMRFDYRSNGTLARVRFGNEYTIVVRYDPNGRQEISDSYGDTLIRADAGSGQFTVQTVIDPHGVLTRNLKQLSGLLSLFPTTPASSIAP